MIQRRTLKQWLDELPPKIYDNAIQNNLKDGYDNRLDWEFSIGSIAIQCCFDFKRSIEGLEYWNKVIEIYY